MTAAEKEKPVGLDSIIDLLACPSCKGPLTQTANKDGFVCKAERLLFPIEDGIPILLFDEADSLSTDEMNAALGKS